jgi:ubiquinone/menaquinone biosynthesis C-methylase UbiE
MVAAANAHMHCTSFDLPKVVPIATRRIQQVGLSDRVNAVGGDFFVDPLPQADVITMGMILHDWNVDKKKILIRKAYEALQPGGAFVVIEALIDDERRKNAFGLLMSLNMLIEFGDAFDYSGSDFIRWCREAGFRDFKIMPLTGPSSAAIAYK